MNLLQYTKIFIKDELIMSDRPQIIQIFSADGVLSKYIPGFRPRAEQIEMAETVDLNIKNKSVLIVEAGTGTG